MLCLLSYALLIFHFTHFFPSSSTFQVPKRSLPSYQNSLTRPPTSLCLLFLGRIGKERDGTGSCAQITVFPRAPLHIHTWISLLITEWQQVFPKCSFTWNHKTWVGPQLYYSSLWKVREGSQLLIFFFPPKIIANPEIDIGDQRSGIKTAELWLIKVILENKALALWPYWPPNTCAFKSSDYLTPFPTVLETADPLNLSHRKRQTWLLLHGDMVESPAEAEPVCLVASPKLCSEGGRPAFI